MPVSGHIKPTDKTIKTYHATLQGYSDEQVTHEGAVETAFQQLLIETAKTRGWMLIPKLPIKRHGKSIIPDGTVRDEFYLHRGYWEAKDTHDDLSAEISKKTAKGYPLSNTIFEDTRRAVLFQNGRETLRVDLTDSQAVADLLNSFYAHTEPEHDNFEKAIADFKERVPELALGLAEKIRAAHDDNAKFQAAFDDFFMLCQTSLNPNISAAAVEEMLIQHLLTERLIRTLFDKDNFTRQNVIAAEVEKVIDALVIGKSFSRKDFLKSLDRFYRAIEEAGRTVPEFSDKQHFLNTVYERFFQGYSVKTADTHGIVYTPQEIVDFMCASVVEVLQSEFGRKLSDKDVHILDPCTGTGNFLVNLLHRIPKPELPRMYREQLFANEVMLLPYYIAALNIEHAYFELTGDYEPFDGLCFVDTLDLAENRQLTMFTEENTARVARQRKAPITVIVGNPPYNVGQVDENDNNKNRKYSVIDGRIKQTYGKDSKATLNTKLYDPYVKFFRWAMDRLNGRDGIVCFVTNNSFVDQIAFDGMRKHLLKDFSRVYHLHLEGNVRQNPKLSGTAYNVFGIQVGVGITVAVRVQQHKTPKLSFHRIDKNLRRAGKLAWLAEHKSVSGVKWKRLTPDEKYTWLAPANGKVFETFIPIASKSARAADAVSQETIFQTYSLGVSTNRDSVVYDFDRATLAERVEQFCDDYNGEVDRYKRKGQRKGIDDFLDYSKVKWSSTLKLHLQRGTSATFHDSKIHVALYRPFCRQYLYHDDIVIDRPGMLAGVPAEVQSTHRNPVLVLSDIGFRSDSVAAFVAKSAVDLHVCASLDGHQCFPLYVYSAAENAWHENITDWSVEQFRHRYKNRRICKCDIFYYIYGILHHPGYRETFADNLKHELPRIPFAPNFKAFAKAGRELSQLHLDYEQSEMYDLNWIEAPGVPLSYRVEKMKLTKDKTAVVVNPSLTLSGIPPEAFEYRLGNRSALEWVIDQYQVTEDKRSGIRSDPNRADDPEYIVRLIGQVVYVSVETVRIVNSLPDFS